jgi:aerobic-type carbon monoxide dehydrogenase small subunit (CoxS/CutS family)
VRRTIQLTLNERPTSIEVEDTEVLLDVLRGELGLCGARFGCGMGQCGYCLTGILIGAKALLDMNPDPGRAEIAQALAWHLCRCGVHNRIIEAVALAARRMREDAARGVAA